MSNHRPTNPSGSASTGEDPVSSYWLRIGNDEIPISRGEILIGRGEECRVVLAEHLVSRRHARIVVDGGRPYIEDLSSANGTFVNQARLHGKALLFPGDHIFVGTCEIRIVVRTDTRPAVPASPPGDPSPPDSGVVAFEVEGRTSSKPLGSRAPSDGRRSDVTTQVAGLEYVGHLADKMFTMGRVEAAVTILSSHMEDLLRAARSGQVPAPEIVDLAGRYSVKLASQTLDGRWLDALFEVHLAACRPLREETIQQVVALRAKAPLGNPALIAKYHERLQAERSRMTPSERILCERFALVVAGPGSPR